MLHKINECQQEKILGKYHEKLDHKQSLNNITKVIFYFRYFHL